MHVGWLGSLALGMGALMSAHFLSELPEANPIGSAALSTGNAGVTVSGTQTTHSPEGKRGPRAGSPRAPEAPGYPPHEFDFDSCLDDWNSSRGCFRATEPEEVKRSEPGQAPPSARPITMTDLAQFAPEKIAVTGEPGNLGIAGMPMNFVATATTHTRTGTLFGAPIAVRFTPTSYAFVHGDGSTATTADGGRTWSALGQLSFTPTATSHVYEDRGTYLAHVSVRYAAEVDLGAGWSAVPGDLTVDGPDSEIRIFEAHTALVAFTCAENPGAPGC